MEDRERLSHLSGDAVTFWKVRYDNYVRIEGWKQNSKCYWGDNHEFTKVDIYPTSRIACRIKNKNKPQQNSDERETGEISIIKEEIRWANGEIWKRIVGHEIIELDR
eukprot:UN21392